MTYTYFQLFWTKANNNVDDKSTSITIPQLMTIISALTKIYELRRLLINKWLILMHVELETESSWLTI